MDIIIILIKLATEFQELLNGRSLNPLQSVFR